MKSWHRRLALCVLLASAGFGAPAAARQVAPPAAGSTSAPAPPPKTPAPKVVPSAKTKETPQPKTDKAGADPDDNGGPTRAPETSTKRCARGRVVEFDPIGKTLHVATSQGSSVLRFTTKTILRIGEQRDVLVDAPSPLKKGTAVTIYCAREGSQDVAALVRVEGPKAVKAAPVSSGNPQPPG